VLSIRRSTSASVGCCGSFLASSCMFGV
jgi:hypothetical protein